jgi:WD40 repeat protein
MDEFPIQQLKGGRISLLRKVPLLTNRMILKNWSPYLWWTSWSPDGKKLAAACSDGRVVMILASSGERLHTWQLDHSLYYIAWSKPGQKLVVTHQSGWSKMDIDTGSLDTIKQPFPAIEAAWTQDGSSVALTCDDGTIWIDPLHEQPRLFKTLIAAGRGISWGPSGCLAAGDAGGSAYLFDKFGKEIWRECLDGEVICLRWRPGSSQLLVATRGHEAWIADHQETISRLEP